MPEVFPFLTSIRPGKPWDEVLLSTTNFVVVPTVGALVEGWLMIVTKQSYLSMGAIPPSLRGEFSDLKQFVAESVDELYGSVALFEHGPSARSQRVGCGVDHAHLHVLPAPLPLVADCKGVSNIDFEWRSVDEENAPHTFCDSETPYLYVEQPLGRAFITDATLAPSQLFRRVVAHQIGTPSLFNWRDHAMENNVMKTVTRFSGFFKDKSHNFVSI